MKVAIGRVSAPIEAGGEAVIKRSRFQNAELCLGPLAFRQRPLHVYGGTFCVFRSDDSINSVISIWAPVATRNLNRLIRIGAPRRFKRTPDSRGYISPRRCMFIARVVVQFSPREMSRTPAALEVVTLGGPAGVQRSFVLGDHQVTFIKRPTSAGFTFF